MVYICRHFQGVPDNEDGHADGLGGQPLPEISSISTWDISSLASSAAASDLGVMPDGFSAADELSSAMFRRLAVVVYAELESLCPGNGDLAAGHGGGRNTMMLTLLAARQNPVRARASIGRVCARLALEPVTACCDRSICPQGGYFAKVSYELSPAGKKPLKSVYL